MKQRLLDDAGSCDIISDKITALLADIEANYPERIYEHVAADLRDAADYMRKQAAINIQEASSYNIAYEALLAWDYAFYLYKKGATL